MKKTNFLSGLMLGTLLVMVVTGSLLTWYQQTQIQALERSIIEVKQTAAATHVMLVNINSKLNSDLDSFRAQALRSVQMAEKTCKSCMRELRWCEERKSKEER